MRVLALETAKINDPNDGGSATRVARLRQRQAIGYSPEALEEARTSFSQNYQDVIKYMQTNLVGQSYGGLGQGGDELVAAVALPAAAAYFAPAAAGTEGAAVGGATAGAGAGGANAALPATGMVGTGTVGGAEGAAWGVGAGGAGTGASTTSASLLGGLLGQGGSNIPAWLGLFGNLWAANQGGDGAAEAADPFASQRPQYQQMLSELMTNPAAFQNTPMFQNALETGTEAVNRGAARSGLLGSGNRLAELQTFGTGLANQNFFQYLNALMPLSGATTGSPAAASNALQTQSQNQSTNYANMLANLAPLLMQYTSYLQNEGD
jgi:hypothetical protein